ncbi:hypothetical protein [Rubellimicrobium roseum]|uniref:Uncharacterized protein n=1 Tax=Rubellimicrobium roseum TaxID=687525 RepID=A0A5C4N6V6_9RHOB|nr:hypothetical protein [Rubellimicrobium roseum]TNC61563.1 hypothetical protein FHG71_20995 [Rubellimicrobium roseum]
MLPFLKPGNFDRRKGAGKGMGFTASEAAKEVGKSLPTITKAIQSGKLSANGPKGGPYSIEPAELFRVWPRVAGKVEETPKVRPEETPGNSTPLTGEVDLLQEKLRSAQALNERLSDEVSDLRARLDAEAEERRRLTALLTYQPEKPTPAPVSEPAPQAQARPPQRSWWQRLRGVEA